MTVTLQILVITGVTVGLLWGCGFLLARPLLSWRLRPFTLLLAPILGLGLVSSLGHYLGAAGLPLRRTAWGFVALAAAGWILALWRPPRRPPRQVAAALVVALLAYGIAVSPVVRLRQLTTVGGNSDALSYVARGEYFQRVPLQPPRLIEGDGPRSLIASQFFLRVGDVYLLGLLGLLTGRRTYELLTVAAALFFALTSGAVFAWARGILRLPRDAALLAALLVGASNLLLWAVYGDFFSQAVATALMLPAVGAGIEAGRRPGWRSAALFGLLVATLTSVYPIYASFAVLFVALDWAIESAALPHGRLLAAGRRLVWGLAAAGLAVAWNGVALARAGKEMQFLSRLAVPEGILTVGRGDVRICPSPTEITGLSAHAGMAYGAPAFELPTPLLLILAVMLCGFALAGWWRLGGRARIATAVLLAGSSGLAAWQRWGLDQPWGYAYGYYKTVAIVALGFLPLAAAGLAPAWRDRRWHWAAVPLTLLAAGLALGQTLWTADYAFERVLVDRPLIAAARAANALPRGAWIWIDVRPDLSQHWFAYLIERHPVSFRSSSGTSSSGRHAPAPRAEYALIERGLDERQRDALDEPWYNPTTSTPIWSSDRYELRRRTGATVATMIWESAVWPPQTTLEVAFGGVGGGATRRDPGGGGFPGGAAGVPARGNSGPRPDAPGPGVAEVRFGGSTRRLPSPSAPARRLQLFLFSASTPAELAVDGAGPRLDLGAGAWLVDLDLGCLPWSASRVVFRHGAGELFLRRFQASAFAAPRPGGCLAAAPLPVGMGYVEQRLAGVAQVDYDVTLVMPHRAGERTYRLGFHVVDEKTAKLYGVWSIDFGPHAQVQEAHLHLDLLRRTAGASAGKRPLPVEITNLAVDSGNFVSGAVWWQFNPLAQVIVDPVLWFTRNGQRVSVTRAAAGGRMTLLEVP